jgi:8-oxo-dGTP diphosphatase
MRPTHQAFTPGRLIAAVVWILLLILSLQHQPAATEVTACPGNKTDPAANAGCLAVDQGRLLVIRQRNGRWSIPGGTQQDGESARCTAYRETLEETGLEMQINELLTVLDNGFHLYHCQPAADSQPQVKWTNMEVREASWALPSEIPASRWRYPEQLPMLLELMEALE